MELAVNLEQDLVGHRYSTRPAMHMTTTVGGDVFEYTMGDVLGYILAAIDGPVFLVVSEEYIRDVLSNEHHLQKS